MSDEDEAGRDDAMRELDEWNAIATEMGGKLAFVQMPDGLLEVAVLRVFHDVEREPDELATVSVHSVGPNPETGEMTTAFAFSLRYGELVQAVLNPLTHEDDDDEA